MNNVETLAGTNGGSVAEATVVVNKEVNMNQEVIVKGFEKLKAQIEGKSVKEAGPVINKMVHNIVAIKIKDSVAKGFKTVTDRDICGFAAYYKILPDNIIKQLTDIAPVSATQSNAMQIYLNEWKNEIYAQKSNNKFVVWYKEARSDDKIVKGKKIYYKSALRYWGLSSK